MYKILTNTRHAKFFLILIATITVQAAFAKTEVTKSVASDLVVKELLEGNKRFKNGKTSHRGQSKEDIERLAKGQSPKSIVLSCSDSRVPPEVVFDQKLGEMFTVRSAGQALSPQAIASIEYSIANLGAQLIVVLGHTNCGAVKAAIDTADGKSAGSDNLDQLVKDIQPRLQGKFNKNNVSSNLKSESWLNARGIAKDLLARSKIILDAVGAGQVKIKVGLYDLATGNVELDN